ncbi:hypothetical protein [Bradyrhizobium sp. RDI18]|uniref:hypothetical protein n=1 Tax=Bradyrhizobium sp. RDI18 TaxID=3367400 RepID=UPI003713A625
MMQLKMNVVDRISRMSGLLPVALLAGALGNASERHQFRLSKNVSKRVRSRLNMSDDSCQNGDVSEVRNEIRESCEPSSGGKGLLVPLYAGATPRRDGTAQRVMDALLRECLKREAQMP